MWMPRNILRYVHHYWEATNVWECGPRARLCHTEARGGFTELHSWQHLQVDMPSELSLLLAEPDLRALRETLSLDPRPHYHDDDGREYGMPFMGWDIRFRVVDGVLHVVKWVKISAV